MPSQFHSVFRANRARKATTGLCEGTMVLTLDGEIPVQHLVEGDRIVTNDRTVVPLKTLSAQAAIVFPVMVEASSLGHKRPSYDMLLPPSTRVRISDWRASAMFGTPTADVPIRKLIDRNHVSRIGKMATNIYHLGFDDPQVIFADGLEVLAAA